jgi:hypothetical protein
MKTNLEPNRKSDTTSAAHQAWLKIVEERVGTLRFGTVQIVVHEGRVTQVDSTERTRFTTAESAAV